MLALLLSVVDKRFFPQLCVILCVRMVEPALHLTCVTVQQSGQMPHVKHVMNLILIFMESGVKVNPLISYIPDEWDCPHVTFSC